MSQERKSLRQQIVEAAATLLVDRGEIMEEEVHAQALDEAAASIPPHGQAYVAYLYTKTEMLEAMLRDVRDQAMRLAISRL